MSPLSAEGFFNVHGLVLTQLTCSSFSVEHLCCVRIWHTSFVLVAMQVRTLHTIQSKPLTAGDSKTIVSMYAAVMCYATVVKIEALVCSLPFLTYFDPCCFVSSLLLVRFGRHPIQKIHYFCMVATNVTSGSFPVMCFMLNRCLFPASFDLSHSQWIIQDLGANSVQVYSYTYEYFRELNACHTQVSALVLSIATVHMKTTTYVYVFASIFTRVKIMV